MADRLTAREYGALIENGCDDIRNMRAALDSAQLRTRSILLNAAADAHGLPGYVNRVETNECLGCGVDADLVGVDGLSGLCDSCAGVGA